MPCREVNCEQYASLTCYPTPEACAENCNGGEPPEPPQCDPPLNCQAPFSIPDEENCECLCNEADVPCAGGEVNDDCACVCPNGKTLNAAGQCVDVVFECGAGGVVPVEGNVGFQGMLAALDACGPDVGGDDPPPPPIPCAPIPLPPNNVPIFCANGQQIGFDTYPSFNAAFCRWEPPTRVLFGVCPEDNGGGGGGSSGSAGASGSSGSSSSSCNICDAGFPDGIDSLDVYERVVCNGKSTLVRKHMYTFRLIDDEKCPTSFAIYDWCCVDCADIPAGLFECDGCSPFPGNAGTASIVWVLNKDTCAWEKRTDVIVSGDCNTCGNPLNRSSSSSSTSATSESSGSSTSSCSAAGATAINFSFQSAGGTPLNQLTPTSAFSVAFAVSDAVKAANEQTQWRLYSTVSPNIDILGGTVRANEAGWSRAVSASLLLNTMGLSGETAQPGRYSFPICAAATNCAGATNTRCGGTVTVVVPPRSSISSVSTSSVSSSSRSTSSVSSSSRSSSSVSSSSVSSSSRSSSSVSSSSRSSSSAPSGSENPCSFVTYRRHEQTLASIMYGSLENPRTKTETDGVERGLDPGELVSIAVSFNNTLLLETAVANNPGTIGWRLTLACGVGGQPLQQPTNSVTLGSYHLYGATAGLGAVPTSVLSRQLVWTVSQARDSRGLALSNYANLAGKPIIEQTDNGNFVSYPGDEYAWRSRLNHTTISTLITYDDVLTAMGLSAAQARQACQNSLNEDRCRYFLRLHAYVEFYCGGSRLWGICNSDLVNSYSQGCSIRMQYVREDGVLQTDSNLIVKVPAL